MFRKRSMCRNGAPQRHQGRWADEVEVLLDRRIMVPDVPAQSQRGL